MTSSSRRAWPHPTTPPAPRIVAGLLAVLLGMAMATPAPAQNSRPGVNRDAEAQQDFQKRLQDYLKLREDLAGKLKPLSPTANAAELAARQDALAAAIRQSRVGARRGDLIPESVAVFIRKTVIADFQKRASSARRGELEEVQSGAVPVINKVFPAKAPLPTVPPLLLKELPVLPDNLQYRFYGRHVVILDGDTQVIIDYVPDVLPVS